MSGLFLTDHKLDSLYLVGSQAFLAIDDHEKSPPTFLQALGAGVLDGTEVNKQVVTVFWGDEAEISGVAEPFYGAVLTIRRGVTPETELIVVAGTPEPVDTEL